MKKEVKKIIWGGVISILVVIGAVWIYNSFQTSSNAIENDSDLLIHADSHSTGEEARTYAVTIVEFGDYQCPACGHMAPVIEKILADNPEVKLVFRHFPLPMHQHAVLAARAAEAAGAQGKFWEMHKALYDSQEQWSTSKNPQEVFIEIAKNLNLDVDKFTKDLTDEKYLKVIQNDVEDGNKLGIDSTPTFFINGKEYQGRLNEASLRSAVEDALHVL